MTLTLEVFLSCNLGNYFLGRLRKPLEMLRPPSVTELLMSDNGDRILEGTITNFFVVRFKVRSWLIIHV